MSRDDESEHNNLTTEDIFRLVNLNLYRKNMIFSHLYYSYDKMIEEDILNYMTDSPITFYEKFTETKIFRNSFVFTNMQIISPRLENDMEPLYPLEAMRRGLTYGIKILFDIEQIQEIVDIASGDTVKKSIGKDTEYPFADNFPLMMRSKHCSLTKYKSNDKAECEFNPGGYFIVGGSEKVVICQDKLKENKPIVTLKKDSGIQIYTCQINSRCYMTDEMQVMHIKIKKDNIMMVKVPIFQTDVNVFILIKAMGILSDKDIINICTGSNDDSDMMDIIRRTLDMCKNSEGVYIGTQEEAIDFLIKKFKVPTKGTKTNEKLEMMQKKMHLNKLLHKSVLPHMKSGLKEKAYFIGGMIKSLLNKFLGREKIDDRDSYINKRIDGVGNLIFELFKHQVKKIIGECTKYFSNHSDIDDMPKVIINQIKSKMVEQGVKTALMTGAFIRRAGVAQVLQRYTYLQYISFLRRVDAPTGDGGGSKLTGPLNLHPSSVGFLCVVETPEHAKVGSTKHLSLIGSISIMSRDQYVILRNMILKKIKNIRDIQINNLYKSFRVLLNGEWLGCTNKPVELAEELNEMRIKGILDQKNVSVVPNYKDREINVYCDGGRLIRPMMTVVNNEILLTSKHIDTVSLNKSESTTKITDWDEFLMKYPGVITYIDMELQPHLMLADKVKKVEAERQRQINSIKKVKISDKKIYTKTTNRYGEMFFIKYTHCEFHPSLLLGEILVNVPFTNRNYALRSIFQYSQGRQAMGNCATNYRDRYDLSYYLYNLQKPLVSTRAAKYMGSEILASGENCMVAIAPQGGGNQEDSLIINRTSIDRGMFNAKTIKKVQVAVQKSQSGSEEQFLKPDANRVFGMKPGSYEKLNDLGYAPPETVINYGDVLFGKVLRYKSDENDGKDFKDNSEIYKSFAAATVDRVQIGIINQDGGEVRKMSLRSLRITNIGDKFCSRHGQKGTCGILINSIDLPFDNHGNVPDVIVNPNAIPKRMTVGQLLECLFGKLGALKGCDMDGTPFEDYDIKDIERQLEELGYDPKGYETMYNGMTGRKMKVKIFFGPTYYQRLKHMVADKIHGRAMGSRSKLTKSPLEGRSREGGLRLGEMERDAIIAHGTMFFLHEKMLYNSDAFVTHVCDICGCFAQRLPRADISPEPSPTDVYYCNYCMNYNKISKIMIPYSFKLLLQELASMCILGRIRTKKDI